MDTWNLAITQQTDTAVRMLAELSTADPAVAAATLRAVADQLDPPRPTLRRRDPGRETEPVHPDRPTRVHTHTGACAYADKPGA